MLAQNVSLRAGEQWLSSLPQVACSERAAGTASPYITVSRRMGAESNQLAGVDPRKVNTVLCAFNRRARCSTAIAKEARLAASAVAALSAMAASEANGREIEEVLMLEMKTASKYLWRGEGLLHAFEHASPAQRKSLIRGAMDNYVAVEAAIVAAEAADATTPQVLEEARSIADELTKVRSEMLQMRPYDL